VEQESVGIKQGSEIISGPQKEGNIILHDLEGILPLRLCMPNKFFNCLICSIRQ
jgi:hypothetical protein